MKNIRAWAPVAAGLIAAILGLSRAYAGELQNVLNKSKAYATLPTVKHVPAFRLDPFEPAQHFQEAKGKQWWYICDGDERIGLITTWLNHVELFRFSPDVDKGAKYEIPEVYHWANLIGARLPLQMCGYHSPVPPVGSFKLTFTKQRGDSLEFKAEQIHKDDYEGSTEFRLAWDDRLGYVLNCTSHFAMPQPRQIEFNNLLAGGISESRDDHKRWQKTMRGRLLDGRITGFCVETGKFVYLQWKRGEKKPEPMAKLWDSATGEMIEIYKCPDCPQPFIPLRRKANDADGPGFDHCPKCGKQTFQVDKAEGILMFD